MKPVAYPKQHIRSPSFQNDVSPCSSVSPNDLFVSQKMDYIEHFLSKFDDRIAKLELTAKSPREERSFSSHKKTIDTSSDFDQKLRVVEDELYITKTETSKRLTALEEQMRDLSKKNANGISKTGTSTEDMTKVHDRILGIERRVDTMDKRLEHLTYSLENFMKKIEQGLGAAPMRQSARRSEIRTEVRSETKPEVRSEARDIRAEIRAEIKSEMKPEPRSEARAEIKPELRSEARAEARAELRNEPRSEVRSETRNEVGSDTRAQLRNELRTEARGELRSELRTEARSETRNEPGSDVRAQLRNELRAEARGEIKNEPRTENRNEFRNETRAEANKYEARLDAKNELRHERLERNDRLERNERIERNERLERNERHDNGETVSEVKLLGSGLNRDSEAHKRIEEDFQGQRRALSRDTVTRDRMRESLEGGRRKEEPRTQEKPIERVDRTEMRYSMEVKPPVRDFEEQFERKADEGRLQQRYIDRMDARNSLDMMMKPMPRDGKDIKGNLKSPDTERKRKNVSWSEVCSTEENGEPESGNKRKRTDDDDLDRLRKVNLNESLNGREKERPRTATRTRERIDDRYRLEGGQRPPSVTREEGAYEKYPRYQEINMFRGEKAERGAGTVPERTERVEEKDFERADKEKNPVERERVMEEKRRKIDEEIERRINKQIEMKKRADIAVEGQKKIYEKTSQIEDDFKISPYSTEKSREKEVVSRLVREKQMRNDLINKYSEATPESARKSKSPIRK